MRVLHVVTAFPRSREDVIVPWLVELLKRLPAAGYDVEVFTSAYRGGGGDSYEGIRVHRFRYFFARWEDLTHDEAAPDRMRRSALYRVLPAFYIAGGLWGIWRLARRERFDIVHVHWPVPHVLFGWVARRAGGGGTRMVTTWYGAELRWVQSSLPVMRGFVRWALRTSDEIVAISSYTAREIARFAKVQVRVIPYTLGFPKTPPARPPLSRRRLVSDPVRRPACRAQRRDSPHRCSRAYRDRCSRATDCDWRGAGAGRARGASRRCGPRRRRRFSRAR